MINLDRFKPSFKRKPASSVDANPIAAEQTVATEPTVQLPWFKSMKKWELGLIVGLLIFTILTAAVGAYTYAVGMELKTQAQVSRALAQQAYDTFKGQNLPESEARLIELDQELANVTASYKKLSFYRYVPVVRKYYIDGEHGLAAAAAGLSAGKKSLAAITPYADVLGFTGEESFEGGTTEDRVKVLLETLDKVTPILEDISADLQIVESELAEISPQDYPESFRGIAIREYIIQAHDLSSGAVSAVTEYRPVLEELPKVAGANGETKKYVILFQNDNELRPTGGFLTAYSIINVTDGKVEAERSDDIYQLDQKFRKNEPIPEKLGRYLTTERRWNIRDMNISPDFKDSMDIFYEHYQQIPGEPADQIDGIIAVDTEFLTSLIKVLGPVQVPGYGTFTAENDPRCDCPQIIYVLSEIITRPTPFIREDRKGILGPLMSATLAKAYAAPKQQWPDLFGTGFASIRNRHAQFYFLDEQAQNAAEAANAAGRMTVEEDSDFLGIINANLGGAKSNLFITYDVNQEVSAPEDGLITKTIEITYKNNRRADNCNLEAGLLCLNSTLRDWTRIYVPEGSELISAQGFTQEPESYEENGFTVFDGFFTLEPLAQARLRLTYKVPYNDTANYQLLMWKQGGIESYSTLIDVTGGQEQMLVEYDLKYQTPF